MAFVSWGLASPARTSASCVLGFDWRVGCMLLSFPFTSQPPRFRGVLFIHIFFCLSFLASGTLHALRQSARSRDGRVITAIFLGRPQVGWLSKDALSSRESLACFEGYQRRLELRLLERTSTYVLLAVDMSLVCFRSLPVYDLFLIKVLDNTILRIFLGCSRIADWQRPLISYLSVSLRKAVPPTQVMENLWITCVHENKQTINNFVGFKLAGTPRVIIAPL